MYQVPPGHYLIATDDVLQIHRYWDLDFAYERDLPGTYNENEYIERFRDLFEQQASEKEQMTELGLEFNVDPTKDGTMSSERGGDGKGISAPNDEQDEEEEEEE